MLRLNNDHNIHIYFFFKSLFGFAKIKIKICYFFNKMSNFYTEREGYSQFVIHPYFANPYFMQK